MSAIILGAMMLAVSGASALAQSWTGSAGDDKWSTPGNWDSGVPGTGGNVILDSQAHPLVNLDVDATLNSLNVGFAFLSSRAPSNPSHNLTVQGTTSVPAVQGSFANGFDVFSGGNFRLGTLSNFANGALTGYYSAVDKSGLAAIIQFRDANVITNNASVQITGAVSFWGPDTHLFPWPRPRPRLAATC